MIMIIVFLQGAVLYAHYGQENDFMLLRGKNFNVNGRVILVRSGKISFAEKVGGFSKKCLPFQCSSSEFFIWMF